MSVRLFFIFRGGPRPLLRENPQSLKKTPAGLGLPRRRQRASLFTERDLCFPSHHLRLMWKLSLRRKAARISPSGTSSWLFDMHCPASRLRGLGFVRFPCYTKRSKHQASYDDGDRRRTYRSPSTYRLACKSWLLQQATSSLYRVAMFRIPWAQHYGIWQLSMEQSEARLM